MLSTNISVLNIPLEPKDRDATSCCQCVGIEGETFFQDQIFGKAFCIHHFPSDICPDSNFDGIITTLPKYVSNDIIDNQIEIWEKEILPWNEKIARSAQEDVYRKLIRMTKIKRLK